MVSLAFYGVLLLLFSVWWEEVAGLGAVASGGQSCLGKLRRIFRQGSVLKDYT